MKTATLILPAIRAVEFTNDSMMFIHLDNDRTFLVPLDKFKPIKKLNKKQREDFEIIDDIYLSFIDMDEIYSLNELIGIP